MIQNYTEHKNTDSRFLPSIPKHWKKLKVKHLVNPDSYYPVGDGDHGSIKPSMYEDEGVPYIRVQNLSWNGKISYKNIVCISNEVQEKNKKSVLRPGDILIAKTGATIGKLGLIDNDIVEANTTSSVGKVTVDKKYFIPRYILYCFQSSNFNDQIWLEASQKSAQPGFNIDDLIQFELAVPDKIEQTKIAAYLDHQTGLIDTIIEKKQLLIEKLKEQRQAIINEAVTKGLDPNAPMKDSGVEWLGEIPEDWDFTSVKNVLAIPITDGPHTTPELIEDGIPFISAEAIKNGEIDFNKKRGYISKEENEQFSKKYSPELKDIYMVKSGATTGNIAMVKTQKTFNIWSPLAVFRAKKEKICPEYLFFFLQSSIFRYQVELNWSYGTQQNIGMGVLSNLKISFPQINEQKNIITILNTEINRIDSLIPPISVTVNKLLKLRQSIISEAVTGKIDVREWEPQVKETA